MSGSINSQDDPRSAFRAYGGTSNADRHQQPQQPPARYEFPRKSRPATEQTSLLSSPDIGSVASAATPSAPRSLFATLAGVNASPERTRALPDPETFAPHAVRIEKVADELQTDISNGLTPDEASNRLAQFGLNQIETPSLSFLNVLREELTEPMILLLIAVAVLYILWGRTEEAVTAMIVICATIGLELWTEYRAKQAVLALASSSFRPPVTCLRGGCFVRLPAEQVVRGDVLEIIAGERLVCDGRVVAGPWLLVDESALTGESRPVSKDPFSLVHPDAPAAVRRNMVHAGTVVTHGSARVIVTATGYQTQLGLIKSLASNARAKLHSARTPMQVAMKELALHLTIVAAVCCFLVMSIGFMRGLSYQTVVLMGLSLAFATIPEELPLLIKCVLAVGALQLSKKSVLVKSLRTAEALGSISLLLTDKTGTLTRNSLAVLRLAMPGRVIKVPRPPNCKEDGGHGDDDGDDPPQPFRASTEDVLAFEPLLAQGWLLSAPSLTDQLTSRAAGVPTTAAGRAALAERALDAGFNAQATLDAFDAAVLRFFAQKRASAQDLNSTFLRRLFSEALHAASSSQLVHVLPYDALRRRSSTIRRVATSLGGGATGGQSRSSTPASAAAGTPTPPSTDPLQSGQLRLCTRGGAEFVLSACSYALHADGGVIKLGSEAREELRSQLRKMADAGLRIMAFAVRRLEQSDLDRAAYQGAAGLASPQPSEDEQSDAGYQSASAQRRSVSASPALGPSASPHPAGSTLALASLEHSMTFLGFIGFGDTLRDGVASSVRTLQGAGIEVKLVTGDFERTGAAVARAVGVLPPRGKHVPPSGAGPNQTTTAVNRFAQKPFSKEPSPYAGQSSDDEDAQSTRRAAKFPHTSGHPLPAAAMTGVFQSPPTPSTSDASSQSLKRQPSGRSRSSSKENRSAEAAQMEGICIGGLRSAPKEKRRSASKPGVGSQQQQQQQQPSASPIASSTDFAIGITAAQPSATPSNPSNSTASATPTWPRGKPPTNVLSTPPFGGNVRGSPTPSLSRVGSTANGNRAVYDLRCRVFCRMTPQDKLNLVIRHREVGHTVLVTGDGVNDAPSLASADAGLAMGSSGTDLAREMAGIILTDDDFRHVVTAIAEGRRTLDNLQKAVRYYLSCKLAIILLFLLPLSFGMDLPLSPLHIILLEAFLDLGASAAYTSEAPDGNLMTRKPQEWGRGEGGFMRGKRFWGKIVVAGMLLLASVGGVLFLAHQMQVVHNYPSSSSHHYSEPIDAYDLQAAYSHPNSDDPSASPLPLHSSRAPPPPPIEAEQHHSGASSSDSRHQHSSSSFFPSIIDQYHPDPHLALTQSLVLTSWLLASVLLATFMRSFGRSYVFGCCDRRAIRRWKVRRNAKAAAAAANVPGPSGFTASEVARQHRHRPAISSFVAAHQASYASLASMENGAAYGSVGEEDRVDQAAGLGGVAEEERSDYSSGDEQRAASPCPPDELEGLSKRCNARAEKEWMSSDLAELCPLLSNPIMLVWIVLSIAFGAAAVHIPWMRRTFALAPLDVLVTMPNLTGSRAFPAYVVLLLPLGIFFAAELGKFIASWRNGRKQAALEPYAVANA